MTGDGTLVTIDGRPALRFERRYRHPVDRVWNAISNADEMARWFPSHVEGERAVGAALVFADESARAAARAEGRPTREEGAEFQGTVVAYDPPHVFSFTWGGELLRFELLPDGDGTRLVFTQVLSHPSVAARNGAGWHQCLGALDRLLGAPVDDSEDWRAVYDDYVTRLGPPTGAVHADGSVTWEQATHVGPERVREVVHDPAAWGAAGRAGEPLQWDVASTPNGSVYRLTHAAIGGNASLAATWHALLVQLDLYLAAGQFVTVDPTRWVAPYEALLAGTASRRS